MVDVSLRAKRVAKESWLTYLQRGTPESDGNPKAESDKVFLGFCYTYNLERSVNLPPRAKRKAKQSFLT